MANSKRREEYTDRNGNMFMPMSVEGGFWKEGFFSTSKTMCIIGIFATLVIILAILASEESSVLRYIIYLSIWSVISIYITRFVIFEEKFYYRMYKELKNNEITNPSVFWNIASIKDTEDGATINFSDGKIGVFVKIERDTITGKREDFMEYHYDAISDFYKSIVQRGYSLVQLDIMESAGKDNRLNELSKLVNKSDNQRVCKLMNLQIGYIRNITNVSLCESDYFLVYSNKLSRSEYIIQDVTDSILILMDGAYIGFQVLNHAGIVDMVKELSGVNYFNSTSASLEMFEKTNFAVDNVKPFNIDGVLWNDGYMQMLDNSDKTKLSGITSRVVEDRLNNLDVALKKAIYRKDYKKKVGVKFDMDDIDKKTEDNSSNLFENGGDYEDQYINF